MQHTSRKVTRHFSSLITLHLIRGDLTICDKIELRLRDYAPELICEGLIKMYDSQLLKNRIVDLVDSLPEDGLQLLSEFTNFLRLKYKVAKIHSPRLVDRTDISKFELEVAHE